MNNLFFNGQEVWHIFLEDLTHLSDVLVITQMHDSYKWDISRDRNEQGALKEAKYLFGSIFFIVISSVLVIIILGSRKWGAEAISPLLSCCFFP